MQVWFPASQFLEISMSVSLGRLILVSLGGFWRLFVASSLLERCWFWFASCRCLNDFVGACFYLLAYSFFFFYGVSYDNSLGNQMIDNLLKHGFQSSFCYYLVNTLWEACFIPRPGFGRKKKGRKMIQHWYFLASMSQFIFCTRHFWRRNWTSWISS